MLDSGSSPSSLIGLAERAQPPLRFALLCLLAGRDVACDEQELRGALRRSELLLAAGGDPRRPLELYGRAVTALARDLDGPGRRAHLQAGLEGLAAGADPHGVAAEALARLARDPDLAWQCFAMAVLADNLGRDDESVGQG